MLALVQVTTAARMWGRLGFLRVHGASVARVHRWSGRLAFVFTLPVFFHCVTILGFETPVSPGRTERHAAASSVAPIFTNIGTPCVLASHSPGAPADEASS